jgi:GNAT superfamily N-acetyltransferase
MRNCEIHVRAYGEKDIAALVEVHLTACKGYMNAGIGRGYVREMFRWFLSRPDAVALMAEIDGRACGYVVGMPVEDHPKLNRDLMFASAWGVATHPWVLLERRYRTSALAKIKRVLALRKPAARNAEKLASVNGETERQPERCIGLVGVAVTPEFSGRGVGVAVVKAFEDHAKGLGFDVLQLSVHSDNCKARAVYDKAGWELNDTGGPVVFYRKRVTTRHQPAARA